MTYTILENKNSPYSKNLDIIIWPHDPVIVAFFVSLNIDEIDECLIQLFENESYFQSPMSVRFYSNLDWEDLKELNDEGVKIEVNETIVYHEVIGISVVETSIFIELILAYANKHLTIYKTDSSVSVGWENRVEKAIRLLRTKIV
jgi:hypothetical protein